MWEPGWRERIWAGLEGPWDIVVIGGGITGAGILYEAARMGVAVLLLEKDDFASGTSSKSGKLVHGGLRYLKQGQVRITWHSVRERERLLRQLPGLVEPLGFLLPIDSDDRRGRLLCGAGLAAYDVIAGRRTHRFYPGDAFAALVPHVRRENLGGGFRFEDAQTDDARLVLRVIKEAVDNGAVALNYARVEGLLRDSAGHVQGVTVRDRVTGKPATVRAASVINATGAWGDSIRAEVGRGPRLRPLRGSHLVFPAVRFPVSQAVSFLHPCDRRPVYAFPWENITLMGTTDVPHDGDVDGAAISADEAAYLLEAARYMFPSLELQDSDVISAFAGVRPIVNTGAADPSRESREHAVWLESGLLTVTGGKLTTFRVLARDALRAAARRLPRGSGRAGPPAHMAGSGHDVPSSDRRLKGRYGDDAVEVIRCARGGELDPIPGTPYTWSELRWAARAEGVVHLADLLLRRLRMGLLLPSGGADLLPRVKEIVVSELGWDDGRWKQELADYLAAWNDYYSPPAADRTGKRRFPANHTPAGICPLQGAGRR